jgi:hypothetical protein
MTELSDAAKAEELSKRRVRALPVLAVIFLGQQAAYFSGGTGTGDRPVDHVHIAAWLVLSIVILLALTTGGGWIYSRQVRRLANDEVTRAYRDQAFRVGFLASMATCVVIYFLSMFETFGGREAVHLVMTIGIASTLLWFALLERRAHRDG